jgi:hypothetical protein
MMDSLETLGAAIFIFILLPAALAGIVVMSFIAFCVVMVAASVLTIRTVITNQIWGTQL